MKAYNEKERNMRKVMGIRMNGVKKTLRPRALLKGAWKGSRTLKTNVTKYVGSHPFKSSGVVALGLAALGGAILGYLKRK
jgi:hypothetical protein